MHGTNMLLEAKRWLQQAHPHWNRTGGRDHIWLASHDEGSCWVPGELRASIILSHWGRRVGPAWAAAAQAGAACRAWPVKHGEAAWLPTLPAPGRAALHLQALA